MLLQRHLLTDIKFIQQIKEKNVITILTEWKTKKKEQTFIISFSIHQCYSGTSIHQ